MPPKNAKKRVLPEPKAASDEENYDRAPVEEASSISSANDDSFLSTPANNSFNNEPQVGTLGQSPELKPKSVRPKKTQGPEDEHVSAFDGSGSSSIYKKSKTQENEFRNVLSLVCKAVEENPDRKGTSIQAIRNWMKARFDAVGETRIKLGLKKAIEKGLESGVLIRPKSSADSHGMTGRFRVSQGKLAQSKTKGKPKKPAKETKKDADVLDKKSSANNQKTDKPVPKKKSPSKKDAKKDSTQKSKKAETDLVEKLVDLDINKTVPKPARAKKQEKKADAKEPKNKTKKIGKEAKSEAKMKHSAK